MVAVPAIYYVSASAGSDSNFGTESSPWQHLVFAMGRLKEGDILLVKRSDVYKQDCPQIPADGVTLATYGTGAAPVIDGGNVCANGISNDGYEHVTVNGIWVRNTTAQGYSSIAGKNGTGSYFRLLNAGADFTGDSSVLVRNADSSTAPPVVGVLVQNFHAGVITRPYGLNYNVAGVQFMGLTGAVATGIWAGTLNQMGFQDRPFHRATCSGNILTRSQFTNNEGNVTAECPYDNVNQIAIRNSRGFGVQVAPYSKVDSVLIDGLKVSRDGKLYNGIDGQSGQFGDIPATHVTYSRLTIRNVFAGCAITVEHTTDVTISGGTIDSTKGTGCALYTTADSMPVKFDPKTVWITNGKAFRIGGLAYGDMQSQATFLQKQGIQ